MCMHKNVESKYETVENLRATLHFIKNVSEHNDVARIDFCRDTEFPLVEMLLAFVVESIDEFLRCDILITTSALCRSPTAANRAWELFDENNVLEKLNHSSVREYALNCAIAKFLNALISMKHHSNFSKYIFHMIDDFLLQSYKE